MNMTLLCFNKITIVVLLLFSSCMKCRIAAMNLSNVPFPSFVIIFSLLAMYTQLDSLGQITLIMLFLFSSCMKYRIAAMNHVLPPEYSAVFSQLHDQAPTVPLHEVEKLFMEEFHKSPSEVIIIIIIVRIIIIIVMYVCMCVWCVEPTT